METTPLPPWTDPSPASLAVFLAVCAVVVGAFVAASLRAGARPGPLLAGVGGWLAVTGAAAATGALTPGPTPPPLLVFFVLVQGTAIALALSPFGARLAAATPLAALVGVQAFRLPLELVLHRWHAEGVVPLQMTFQGLNFDVVTGVSSLLAGLWLARRPEPAVAWAANALGAALLLAVMGLAVTSAPGPLYRFTDAPPLQLPLHFPTVWIVSVCVAGALFFHLVTFRALARGRVPSPRRAPAPGSA